MMAVVMLLLDARRDRTASAHHAWIHSKSTGRISISTTVKEFWSFIGLLRYLLYKKIISNVCA